MSRLFDGVDDRVAWSIGSCNLTGAWTLAAVIKLDSGVSWQSYLSNDTSASASVIAMGRHSSGNIASYTGGGANTQTAISHSSSDGWMLVAVTRTAGTGQIPRMHKYPIGGSPTHTNGGAGQDNQASQAGGAVVFGDIDSSDWFKGRIAVAAEWTSALSDANIEALVTTFTRAGWLSLSPAGLWDELDAFATDHTGNGASRSSITGTADNADDPTGWASWAGGGGATLERSAAVAATGAVTVANRTFFTTFARTAAVAATGAIAAVGQRARLRQTAIAATGLIAVSGEIEGATTEHERSAAIAATAAITLTARTIIPQRAATLAATGLIAVTGEIAGALTRTASLNATAAITVTAHRRYLLRQSAITAIGLAAVGHQRYLHRQIAINGVGLISSVGQIGEIPDVLIPFTYREHAKPTHTEHAGAMYREHAHLGS